MEARASDALKSAYSEAEREVQYAGVKHTDATSWEGVAPTNNHAELEFRPSVMRRKRSFGSQSERGERFAERMMTVVHTTDKQGETVLDFLVRTITAHVDGTTAPELLGEHAAAAPLLASTGAAVESAAPTVSTDAACIAGSVLAVSTAIGASANSGKMHALQKQTPKRSLSLALLDNTWAVRPRRSCEPICVN